MKNQINSILEELCKHEISKQEARDRLFAIFGTVSGNSSHKEALNAAISAIYFNDSSDYLRALYQVVHSLTGIDELLSTSGNIDRLFRTLNPE